MEALWWRTQWTMQQQTEPPCPTSIATHSTPSVFMLWVVWLVEGVSPEWFLYQWEVLLYLFNYNIYHITLLTYPSSPFHSHYCHFQVTDASIVRVAPNCFNTTHATYSPEGHGETSLQLRDPAATEIILTDLQCNTHYTITVVATAGEHRRESVAVTVLLPLVLSGMTILYMCTVVSWKPAIVVLI